MVPGESGLTRQQRRANERAVAKELRRTRLASGAIATVGSLLVAGTSAAATFTVTNLSDAGAGSLRQAVGDANTTAGADTILFQSGLSGTIVLTTGEIAISESVTIDGPGQAVLTVSGNNSSRIFNIDDGSAGVAQSVAVDGLSLVNGASGAAPGGAILARENLSLSAVTISGSTSSGSPNGGGGVAVFDAEDVDFTNATISNNSAPLVRGGGILLSGVSSAVLTNVTVSGNRARFGDGLAAVDSVVEVSSSVFSANGQLGFSGYGGAMWIYGGEVQVEDSVIADNFSFMGGGIYMNDAQLGVERTSLVGNNGYNGLGGALAVGGTATLTNVTVTGNNAFLYGSAIWVSKGTAAVFSSTLAGNGGECPITNSGSLSFTNSIAAETTCGAVATSHSFIAGDPQLGPPADNNSTIVAGAPGSTRIPQTMLPQCGSPVINAGDPAFAPPPATDQRGLPRVVGGRIDIGAVEVNPGTIEFSTNAQMAPENGGTVTITATRSGGADHAVSVSYATADGSASSAAAGAGTPDFAAASGTLSWASGETANKSFNVTIADDAVFEGSETFSATLSSVNCGAALGANAMQTVTIADSDAQPSISIGDVSQVEGNGGTTNFVFTVSLSNPSTETITAGYATADGSATASGAGAGNPDYAPMGGTVTFAPGTTSQTITVPVNGDTVSEASETFTVTLSSPSNASIGTGTGTGTIQNDDAAAVAAIPTLSETMLMLLASLFAAIGGWFARSKS